MSRTGAGVSRSRSARPSPSTKTGSGTLLKKIVLPIGMREEAMKALYRMNITNATLFPDLDGLAKSIGMELEMEWPGMAGGGERGDP